MTENYKNFEIYIAPTAEQARALNPDVTIEAEYGDECVEGKYVTLAHHGSRSDNPPPCDTPDVPVLDKGVIVLSHLDLDALGGVLAVTGDKPDDPEFWKGAGYVDVHGAHNIHDLREDVQQELTAFSAQKAKEPRERITDVKDVKEDIGRHLGYVRAITDPEHEKNREYIEYGKEWQKENERQVEDRCVFENNYVRGFVTDGVYCAASYYSPEAEKVIPCTVTYNTNYNTITVAFADGGRENGGKLSAKEIVQELWGKEAGGRDGVAGSPRGQEMTREDFEKAKDRCIEKIVERNREEQTREVKRGRDEPER